MAKTTKKPVECRHCRTDMELLTVKKYTGKWSYVLVVTGVFCSLFIVGALVGIPLLLLGIYRMTAKQAINYCPNCGHYFKVWLVEETST